MQPQKQHLQLQPAATTAASMAKSGPVKSASATDRATELDRQKTIGAKLATRFAEALRALA
jgi:hypothetical protein